MAGQAPRSRSLRSLRSAGPSHEQTQSVVSIPESVTGVLPRTAAHQAEPGNQSSFAQDPSGDAHSVASASVSLSGSGAASQGRQQQTAGTLAPHRRRPSVSSSRSGAVQSRSHLAPHRRRSRTSSRGGAGAIESSGGDDASS